MVNKDIVYKYLEILEESIDRIANMDFTFDMVLGDEDIQDLLDRRMQKAIESTIDIAAHLVASEKLGKAKSSSDLFLLLGDNKIITQKLSKKMAGAAGLRNIIVHKYADLDYKLAYFDLDSKLDDLKDFARETKKYLEKTLS